MKNVKLSREFCELQPDELTEIEGGGWFNALKRSLTNSLIWTTAMYTYNHFYSPIKSKDI